MKRSAMTRRTFMSTASAGTLAALVARSIPAYGNLTNKTAKLAMLGGKPVRTKSWPTWPIWDKAAEKPDGTGLQGGEKG